MAPQTTTLSLALVATFLIASTQAKVVVPRFSSSSPSRSSGMSRADRDVAGLDNLKPAQLLKLGKEFQRDIESVEAEGTRRKQPKSPTGGILKQHKPLHRPGQKLHHKPGHRKHRKPHHKPGHRRHRKPHHKPGHGPGREPHYTGHINRRGPYTPISPFGSHDWNPSGPISPFGPRGWNRRGPKIPKLNGPVGTGLDLLSQIHHKNPVSVDRDPVSMREKLLGMVEGDLGKIKKGMGAEGLKIKAEEQQIKADERMIKGLEQSAK